MAITIKANWVSDAREEVLRRVSVLAHYTQFLPGATKWYYCVWTGVGESAKWVASAEFHTTKVEVRVQSTAILVRADSFQAASGICAFLPRHPCFPLEPMTLAEHNKFPKGRWSRE